MERRREEDVERRSSAKRARIDAVIAAAKERLFALARNGNLEELQTLLNSVDVRNGKRAELINSVDYKGETILLLAAENNDLPMIEWILSDSGGRAAGFNYVLTKTVDGRTALQTAVTLQAFLAIVEGCKVENGERGAMLNAVTDDGETVLHRAALFGCEDIMNWLLSEMGSKAGFNRENLFAMTSDNRSILHLAVSSSEISTGCLDLILRQCKNAEERCRLLFGLDFRGWTVLHCAALSGRLPIVEWVVSHLQEERGGSNEDLFALTDDKESTLLFAARVGCVEVFDFLLSHCNNTSERLRLFLGRDDKGWTIFYHAAQFSEAETISHILRSYPEESKMIIDSRDHRGMTVLHRTIIGGLNTESRREWGDYQRANKQETVRALLGFEDIEDDVALQRGARAAETDVAAINDDEEDGGKKSIEEKKVVTIAAGGADPNVGLKFE